MTLTRCSRRVAVALFSVVIPWSSFVSAQDTAVAKRGHILPTHSAVAQSASPAAFGGTDVNLITGAEISPRVMQAESAIWGHQNTVVAVYSDSSGDNLSPPSYCGVSTSTDAGSTFTRLPYKFNVGGGCYGAASVVYSVHAHKWIASFLAERCGGGGIGTWISVNAIDWVNGSCAFSGDSTDRPSLWVDNNPSSPYFGYLYAAFNDFSTTGGSPRVARSIDDGATWAAPSTASASFRRVQKVTGSLGADGILFVQTVDEGGGGLANARQNFIYRSTDGGLTWYPPVAQGPTFPAPGRSAQGYNVGMYSTPVAAYWTEMGWGEPAVGPNGTVHYAYTAGDAGDPGNIYYVRSSDTGFTWSTPARLNSDATSRGQWGVSLSVNAQGAVFVSWYDERNTDTDALQRFGRASLDNGLTWGQDMPISDVIFPKPLQPDGNVSGTFVGTYNHTSFSNDGNGSYAYHTWTDGRVSIEGSPQQDVFFDKIAPVPAFAVTTTDDHDDGTCNAADCTLREAIVAANARAGDDRIVFAAGVTGAIQLGSALPSISSNIELAGPGANVLSVQRGAAASNIRIFNVTSGSTFSTISGLTIANGSNSGSGGGIANAGTLVLANITLADNHALNGGGIFNDFGTLTIVGSTISGNSVSGIFAGSGGGIFNSGGALTIIDSTISGNSAVGPGGTSDSGGGIITNVGSVVLANSTIAFNSGDIGGGICNVNGGTVRSRSTIIANNTSASGPDVNGPLLSEGFNLIGNDGGANASITPTIGDQIGTAQSPVDPLLDPLQDNGGSNFTHALRSGSPAIDKGRSSGVSVDQRGLLRTADLPYVTNAAGGDGSDIGSFEFQSDVIFRNGFEP